MYILDTADDSLAAVLDLGFVANGVAASGDSALAYLTSLNSNLIRRVDLVSNELEQTGLYLPEVAMDIVTSPRDSRTYVAGRRAIYELDDRTERFLRPILSSTIDIATSITNRAKSFSGGAPLPGGSAPASAMRSLTGLHVGASRRFFRANRRPLVAGQARSGRPRGLKSKPPRGKALPLPSRTSRFHLTALCFMR